MTQHAAAPADVVDPVCGMTITPADAVGHVDYRGQTYYFCADSCLERFRADPESFLNPAPAAPETPVAEGTKFTCPMHPEIVRDGPGACPICGMALEPVMPALDEGPNPELIDMTRRFWGGAAMGLPIFLLPLWEMRV